MSGVEGGGNGGRFGKSRAKPEGLAAGLWISSLNTLTLIVRIWEADA
jgi:hypothetical protein